MSPKKAIIAATTAVTAILSILAILAYLPNSWICDLCSQFRLIFTALLLICLVILLALRSKPGMAICLSSLLINSVPIVSIMMPTKKGTTANSTALAILNFNTEFQHNDNYQLYKDLVAQCNPDILALVEVDQKWINAISPTTKAYPYNKVIIAGAGMALFSKLPIEKCEIRSFGRSHHPRIFATVKVGDRHVNLILAHPTTPKSESGYAERNQELRLIRDEIRTLSGPTVLIGDLNCGPWAPAFYELLTAGLTDSQQGFGPQPSWPARSGRVLEGIPIPPFVPIDHVLVSNGVQITERQAGPAIESDHLPVFVRLLIQMNKE